MPKNNFNYYLFFTVISLTVFGVLFLSTLSAPASFRVFGVTNYYFFHQLAAIAVGLILGAVAFKTPLHILKKWAPILIFINLALLIAVFIPGIGSKFWGAKRWINIGIITLQPSELLKITTILYVSAWLSNKSLGNSKKDRAFSIKKGYYELIHIFVPFAIFLIAISAIMVFQKDITTLGIINLTLLSIYFSAKTPFWHTLLIIAGGIGTLLFFIKLEPYRMARLTTFFHPETDPLGKGLQIKQSLIALGSGGFFGKGLGMSSQKFGFLPQSMSDSIFAILGEETGILGCIILIIIFLFFLYLGLKIARSSTDKFSKLTAIGITSWIMIQTFISIGSAAGVIPLGGIPLPFFSYGGSHIFVELTSMGILLNISKNT